MFFENYYFHLLFECHKYYRHRLSIFNVLQVILKVGGLKIIVFHLYFINIIIN